MLICEKEIYGIKDKRKNYNYLEICMINYIIDLRNDNCITNLLNRRSIQTFRIYKK